MKILYSKVGAQNPFGADILHGASLDGPAYTCGAFSIEHFADSNLATLSHTHEDAQGWLNYLDQFFAENFWFEDSGVQIWEYLPAYDDWQDRYGLDGCLSVYHSGHGGMDGNGVFSAPLGANWYNQGTTATSNNMQIATYHANYIFWSTCTSVRVLDGQSPFTTWSSANKGFRMMFGFETTSVDSPDYGSNFWNEWNKNKSLSTAWLDASWDIDHSQAPSAVACGATQAEASDRVFNERLMYPDHVSTAWWWWRWYYAATAARNPNLILPAQPHIALLRPVETTEQYVSFLINQFGLEMPLPGEVTATREGIFSIEAGKRRVAFGNDGVFEVHMAQPNLSNRSQLPSDRAISIARDAVQRYGLDREVTLTLNSVRLAAHAGAASESSGQVDGPHISSTTIQFKQVINGIPVITPGKGEVRITIDNDGAVTDVHASTRPVDQLVDRPRRTIATPRDEGSLVRPRATDQAGYERLLDEEWSKQLETWKASGKQPVSFTFVPDSTEVGYDMRRNSAIIVATRLIEVDCGGGYRKRYRVVVPIVE